MNANNETGGPVKPEEVGSGVTRDPRPTDLDKRFDESCKAIGDGIDRLQRANAIMTEALAAIAEGVACDRDHWSAAVAKLALESASA